MQKLIDITGQKYNRLTVTGFSHRTSRRRSYWDAKCDCGTETKVRGDSLKDGKIKSCGCLTLETLKSQTGENNPNWKGDVSTEYRLARTSLDYKQWRKQALELANNTCKKCKCQSSKGLHVHHIEPFHSKRDLRFSLSNACVLCPNCHRNFHSKYGLKNNTYYQLIEFVNNSSLFTEKDLNNVWFTK